MTRIADSILANHCDASETLSPVGVGKDGGYILSASDHFFEVPVDNLKAFASAAHKMVY